MKMAYFYKVVSRIYFPGVSIFPDAEIYWIWKLSFLWSYKIAGEKKDPCDHNSVAIFRKFLYVFWDLSNENL